MKKGGGNSPTTGGRPAVSLTMQELTERRERRLDHPSGKALGDKISGSKRPLQGNIVVMDAYFLISYLLVHHTLYGVPYLMDDECLDLSLRYPS